MPVEYLATNRRDNQVDLDVGSERVHCARLVA
jgi:hypothetical protein